MQPPDALSCNTSVTSTSIRAELKRVLHSPQFAHKPQLQRFLNFIVEEELAGRGTQLKEYVLGVGVFGRPPDFDPRLDSLVRVEARRLRTAVAEYYRQEGRADPIIIELEKGSYSPSFRENESLEPKGRNGSGLPQPEDVVATREAKRLHVGWIAVSVLLSLCVAASIVFVKIRRPRVVATRDTIVVSDFNNSTGDPVFDETLKQGLTVSLEQSPFLSILSDRQIGQILKLMGRAPAAHLAGDLAIELCLRAGSKATVAGSISRIDTRYVIGLTAMNCATGEAIVHLQNEARNKEAVLKALAAGAAKMREKLGESLGSIQKFDVPIEEVTTPSLEALQAFSMGRRVAREKGSPADIPYYKLAIELDPNFAVALAALGVSYVNLGQPSMGADYLRKAYKLSERTSEHERFRISSYYFHAVTGESEKAIEIYELWKQNYPRDFAPYINLGLEYTWMGQYEKCAEETKQALRLDPGNVLAHSNLIASYIKLGRTQDAAEVLRQAQAQNLSGKFLRSNAYILAFLRGDDASISRQLEEVRGRPGEEDALLSLHSDREAYYGRLKHARELSQQAANLAERAQAKESSAGWIVNSALREAEFGNDAVARRQVTESLRLSTGRDVQVLAALALVRSGDVFSGQRIAQQLESAYPKNTIIQSYWLPTIYAAIELQHRNPARAIELLQATAPYELGSPPPIGVATLYPIYLRGEAYLESRQGDAAAREFKRILDHPGLVLVYPLHALASRELGRAQAMINDQTSARDSYQRFLTLWADADPDIPILRSAGAEYARLN